MPKHRHPKEPDSKVHGNWLSLLNLHNKWGGERKEKRKGWGMEWVDQPSTHRRRKVNELSQQFCTTSSWEGNWGWWRGWTRVPAGGMAFWILETSTEMQDFECFQFDWLDQSKVKSSIRLLYLIYFILIYPRWKTFLLSVIFSHWRKSEFSPMWQIHLRLHIHA